MLPREFLYQDTTGFGELLSRLSLQGVKAPVQVVHELVVRANGPLRKRPYEDS